MLIRVNVRGIVVISLRRMSPVKKHDKMMCRNNAGIGVEGVVLHQV
jgi:hypothetical protein